MHDMSQLPDRKSLEPPGRQHVSFQFEAGTSADVFIHVRPPGEHTHKGITTHVIYESEKDKAYDELVNRLTQTAGRIVEYNFVDGRDDVETPYDLAHELVLLKTMVSSLYGDRSQKRAFELLRRAKAQVFQDEENISNLTGGQRMKLTEILRWHVEDAINNPQPVVHR